MPICNLDGSPTKKRPFAESRCLVIGYAYQQDALWQVQLYLFGRLTIRGHNNGARPGPSTKVRRHYGAREHAEMTRHFCPAR